MDIKYIIKNKDENKYWDDDFGEWVESINNASLYEKIQDKYYSISGEQMLIEGGEWKKIVLQICDAE